MSTTTKKDDTASAIRSCLGNSTYTDNGSENLTTAIDRLAICYEMDNTLEKVGGSIQYQLGAIASAINNLADAIREIKC